VVTAVNTSTRKKTERNAEKEEQYGIHDRPMAGAVIEELAVDGPLRSTLRSRTVDDDVDASSGRELNAVDSDPCWSNPGAAGPGTGGSWIGRAGMSMCRRLIAGLNRSSLRSIGLSLTLISNNITLIANRVGKNHDLKK